jgi:hypothetical protein
MADIVKHSSLEVCRSAYFDVTLITGSCSYKVNTRYAVTLINGGLDVHKGLIFVHTKQLPFFCCGRRVPPLLILDYYVKDIKDFAVMAFCYSLCNSDIRVGADKVTDSVDFRRKNYIILVQSPLFKTDDVFHNLPNLPFIYLSRSLDSATIINPFFRFLNGKNYKKVGWIFSKTTQKKRKKSFFRRFY